MFKGKKIASNVQLEKNTKMQKQGNENQPRTIMTPLRLPKTPSSAPKSPSIPP